MTAPILQARDLLRSFGGKPASMLGPETPAVQALRGVNLDLHAGRTTGVIGESGSGKSTLARLLLLLDKPTSGEILFDGAPASGLSKANLREFRRRIQPVFQNPFSSLNPRMKVGSIVSEPMHATSDLTTTQRHARVVDALAQVGLPDDTASRSPADFSGGQRQRIAIARAIASRPDLIILDEPVSSLDISLRAQILNLLKDIQSSLGTGYLLITHDLETLTAMCDEIAVMYLGKIVEIGPARQVVNNPQHPYTRSLLASSLTLETARKTTPLLAGDPPSPIAPPTGCAFHPRCPLKFDPCPSTDPTLEPCATNTHKVACHALGQSSGG